MLRHKKIKQETKIKDCSFCVYYKKDYIDHQTIVFGHSEEQLEYLEYMHLVGPKGLNKRVKINRLIEIIPENNFYALVVEREVGQLIDKGFIFTNEQLTTTNDMNEVSNHYIHYLLEQMNSGKYELLDTLLEELALHSDFISIFEGDKQPSFLIDNKHYYPLFSSVEELNKYQQCQKTFVFSLSEYIRIVLNDPSYSGIIINPTTHKRSIILNKDILIEIENMKNKKMEEYRTMKEINHKKMRK